MAFSVVIAAPPPPPATGTSFQVYPSFATCCLITLSAAASPPDVHQCSIWTSLLSAAEATDDRPSAPAVITPAINFARSFMVYPSSSRFLCRDRSGYRIQKLLGFRLFGLSSAWEPPARSRSCVDVER